MTKVSLFSLCACKSHQAGEMMCRTGGRRCREQHRIKEHRVEEYRVEQQNRLDKQNKMHDAAAQGGTADKGGAAVATVATVHHFKRFQSTLSEILDCK